MSDLQRQLQNPEGFCSYGAIVEWLEQKHSLTVEYGTVYGTVRDLVESSKLQDLKGQKRD
ncbi:MAG: hypothetical protein HC772_03405 [Leptolyngbyaceae cyanobacterium CRU_2_3]|nr:hypothetical protein [Leptolyngbyaceae cyanobacterium CRU_2_3]